MKIFSKKVIVIVLSVVLATPFFGLIQEAYGKIHSSVVMNEICFLPKDGEPEWIELKNISDQWVNISEWQITNGKALHIVLPKEFPLMPPQSYVLIFLDGIGDAEFRTEINDLSFEEDNAVILHSPSELKGDILGDAGGGECALYASGEQNANSIKSFVVWGHSPSNTNLISHAFAKGVWQKKNDFLLVETRPSGIKGPIWSIEPGGSIGIYADSTGIQNNDWLIFRPQEASPGEENRLPVPKLYLPTNGIQKSKGTVTFSWIRVPVAKGYHFQICEDQECTSVAIDAPDCLEPYYRPEEALPTGKVYYWRVRLIGPSGGASEWSTPFELTVGYPKTR